MSSDGSFPHTRPSAPPDEPESEGARVIEFPSEDVLTPAPDPVPAGTWADEDSERASEVDRLLRPAGVEEWGGGEVVEFPRQPATRRRKKADGGASAPEQAEQQEAQAPLSDQSGTVPTHAPTETGEAEPERPKFLASELLKRDWTPTHPLRRTLRWGAIVLGVLGAIGTPTLGELAPNALGLGLLFALCAAAGIAPLSPNVRGATLATVGTLGAVCVGWMSASTSQRSGTALLIACVTLTASALFFRAAHNRSTLARVLVGVGLVATAGWLVLTGGLDELVVQTLEWQSWIEPVSRVALCMIAVLTLLTFLDPSGSGGAWTAGYALLVWLALDAAGGLSLAVLPVRGEALDPQAAGWMLRAALPLFAALAAGGLCQVWVLLARRGVATTKAPAPVS